MEDTKVAKSFQESAEPDAMYGELVARMDAKVPVLRNLREAANLRAYAGDVWKWQPDLQHFPYRDMLKDIIVEKIAALHGKETADGAAEQLGRNFVAETGPHIALPRDLDKATGDQSPNKNVNTLVFQATVYMAALQHGQGNKYNISLYTGRTPPNNENSAKYFQPSARKDLLLPLIPNKLDGPHSFIPAIGEAKIKELEKEVRKAGLAPADMQRSADVFRIFRETTTGVSDQASRAHAMLMTEAFGNAGVQQVTATLEVVWDFTARILSDKNSLLHKIFSDPVLREDFIKSMSDIRTGWKEGETPFDVLKGKKGGGKSLAGAYQGDMDPETLAGAITRREIIPKGLMEFTAMIVEGGLLPLGGMFQCVYCSEIRDRMAGFIERHNLGEGRAAALREIPVHVAALSPVWGVSQDADSARIMTYGDTLSGAIKIGAETFERILAVRGQDSYAAALLCLNDFLAGNDQAERLTADQAKGLSRRLEGGNILTFAGTGAQPRPAAQPSQKP